MFSRIVKFRRGGNKDNYEDLQGDIAPSPNRVEFHTLPESDTSSAGSTQAFGSQGVHLIIIHGVKFNMASIHDRKLWIGF